MNFKACPLTLRRACKARASKPRRRPSRPSYISRSRLPVRRRLIDRPRADRLLLTGCSKGKVRPATTCLAARSPGLELEESVSGGVQRLPCLRRFGGQRRAGRGADRVRCVRLRHLPTTSLLVDARQSRTVPCAFVTLHVLVMRAREIDAPGVPRFDLVGQSRHTRDTFVRRLPWLTRRRPRLFRRSFAEESSRTVYAPPRTALRPAVRDEVAVVIFLLSFSFFALRQSACRVERRGWVGTVVRPPARLSRVGFQAPAAWSRPDVFVSPRRQQRPTLP